jgi:NADPH:quinone reductase-like Zn-dependent oxidoreductase
VDLVGNRSLADLRRVLKPAGTLVLTGGGHHRGHGASMIKPLLLIAQGLLLSRFVAQQMVAFVAKINPADLLTLKELVEAGNLTPVIDRTYPLSAVPEAMRYLGAGHVPGKVVVTV